MNPSDRKAIISTIDEGIRRATTPVSPVDQVNDLHELRRLYLGAIGRIAEERARVIREMRSDSLSGQEIGDLLGVSRQAVAQCSSQDKRP